MKRFPIAGVALFAVISGTAFQAVNSEITGGTPVPRAARHRPTPRPNANTEVYANLADGTQLHWLVFKPAGSGPWPACLVIHIGGFRDGPPGSLTTAQDLANAGFIAF